MNANLATKEDVAALRRDMKNLATHEELRTLEERLNRRIWRASVTIIAVQPAALGALAGFIGLL